MLKQVRAGYTDLAGDEHLGFERFIPAGFSLSVLFLVVSAVRLDEPLLLALPPLIWFIGVPVWDRVFVRTISSTNVPQGMGGLHTELTATAAGLATIGVLLVAATTEQSMLSIVALSVTGGVLLSLAAVPAIARRDGEFCEVGGYPGLRSWLFQAMLLLPVLGNNARCRHYNNAATQNDEGSARMGETFFAFLWRFVIGSFTRSLTADRGQAAGKRRGTETENLTKLSCLAILLLCLAYGLGEIKLLLFVVGQAVVALWQILAIEYVEHYGILSKQAESNSTIAVGHLARVGRGGLNTVLLSGRTAHSLDPSPSAVDEKQDDGELPYGFNALSMLVLWPSKWFALADRRLAESVNFDLHEVNLDGNAYVALMEKYHHPASKPT